MRLLPTPKTEYSKSKLDEIIFQIFIWFMIIGGITIAVLMTYIFYKITFYCQ